MTGIGITGHQDIPAQGIDVIVSGIRQALTVYSDLTGYSCLAGGADQLFAAEVLKAGGRLHVVVPCEGYEGTLTKSELQQYRVLVAQASQVTRLPFPAPSEDAYDAAGRVIVDNVDAMIAVWDGQPARGKGGTGDVVTYARTQGVEVKVVWPVGLSRAPGAKPTSQAPEGDHAG